MLITRSDDGYFGLSQHDLCGSSGSSGGRIAKSVSISPFGGRPPLQARRIAKQSFEEVRSQAGAWEREKSHLTWTSHWSHQSHTSRQSQELTGKLRPSSDYVLSIVMRYRTGLKKLAQEGRKQ